MKKHQKLFRFDEKIGSAGGGLLAGIDEAGRGPLAGPVVAAAVIFRGKVSLPGLNDSKQLTRGERESLFKKILNQALIGVARVSETIIDEINILQATRQAMREAVLALPRTPDFLLIDGPIRLDLPLAQKGIIDGDAQSARIAAASIVAKVYRDHWMRELDALYPHYGFALHKGYPTPFHLKVLRLKGATKIHRKTFRPVAEVFEELKK